MPPDIFLHAELPFPKSLPQFQRLFPDDAACATYRELYDGDWQHPTASGHG
ncbi:MAG: hypothetical protein KGL39_50440 [Patescibacteria group bacterium]|nr:hypothetical protein [Patescibacteria group bacterium]